MCDCYFNDIIEATFIADKGSIPQENIGDLILNALKSKPHFIGQVDADKEEVITFEQMRENSVKCALWLKKAGVKKGNVIAICTRDPSIVYVPFLASIYIGAIISPWEANYFEDKIRVMYFLLINEPDVIFVDADNFFDLLASIVILKDIEKVIKIVTIEENKSSIKFNSLESILNDNFDKAEIDNFSCEKIDPIKDLAITTFSCIEQTYPGQAHVTYIAFTSPSNKQTPVMSPGDVGLWYESLCWTHGPLLTVHAILSHVTAIKSAVPSERNLYETIQKYKVTWVFLSSGMCNQLFQTDDDFTSKYDTFSLKTLLFDNWDIRYDIYRKLDSKLPYASIIQVYSKPETGVITYHRDYDRSGFKTNYLGHLAKNVELAFLNNDMEEVGPDRAGFIYCKTPYKRYCYKHTTKELWYDTGDRGCYTNDFQAFFFNNENDSIIKYKGAFLLSRIIEDMLKSHPAVSEAIVTAVPHPIDNQHPRAFVQTKPGAKVTERELIEFVEKISKKENINDYNLHGGVHFITYKIPRLPNGKIDRRLVIRTSD